jgi:DNA-binding phage protein
MPSNTGKTIKRAPCAPYKPAQHEWLRKDAKHSAAYLEAAIETGEPGDLMAALHDIADARGGVMR